MLQFHYAKNLYFLFLDFSTTAIEVTLNMYLKKDFYILMCVDFSILCNFKEV